jgi:gentisate 1,2-dioxygenase
MDVIQTDVSSEVRESWRQANVRPLWESPTAHKKEVTAPRSHIWKWDVVRPLILNATTIQSPAAVERRVLSLVNPDNAAVEDESTVRNLSAAIQILMPGEIARPHRHSMNALRFVLEGHGAYTIVDSKRCLMEEGDLILTPGWCWHEHIHEGDHPIIWLDVLDVPFHNMIGASVFEPGPSHDVPVVPADEAFAQANVLPMTSSSSARHSPVFRYSAARGTAALATMPLDGQGLRRLRFVNPFTGGAVMSLMDCGLIGLEAQSESRATPVEANTIVCVVSGEGRSIVGGQSIGWKQNDIFTLPRGNIAQHFSMTEACCLFVVSDREIYSRLDLL